MSLKAELRRIIEQHGPLSVDAYMTLCLHHPEWGYYATRPAIGEKGDFITAPVISQIFGELIGVWCVETWQRLGSPARFRLVEVGPGDGALMADLLRAGRAAPDFLAAAEVWLVEPSKPLREAQRRRLGPIRPLHWTDSLDGVPEGAPMLLVANEVLDCLPARQFVRTCDGWAERRVSLPAPLMGEVGAERRMGVISPQPKGRRSGIPSATHAGAAPSLPSDPAPRGHLTPSTGKDELMLVLTPTADDMSALLPQAPLRSLVEHSAEQAHFARAIAARVVADGGAALLIDYGRAAFEPGDTLQALRRHQKVDPLAAPGECDLTVWAEFDVVADAARAAGAAIAGPITQATFLSRLGLELRADALARLHPERTPTLARQVHRLTAPDQMGQLFKALAIHLPGDPVPPAFETPA